MKSTLVFGDPHADPEFSNDRFDWAGDMIVDLQPDHIVQMGDFGNFDSVSFHERGQPRLQEGKRLIDDVEAAKDAYHRMFQPLDKYNKSKARTKKRGYKPKVFWLEGNHEERVRRYINTEPLLEGMIAETDIVGAAERAEIVPYRRYCYIEGVAFTHAVMNERANIPVGGKYVGARVCEAVQTSCIYGHHHHRQFHSLRRIDPRNQEGTDVDSLCAGTYSDYYPSYMADGSVRSNWWQGAILIYHTEYGKFDYVTMSMERIKKHYG